MSRNSEIEKLNTPSEQPSGQATADETEVQKEVKRPVVPLVVFNVVVSLILAASVLATGVLGVCIYFFQDMSYAVDFPDPDDHENLGIDSELIEQLPTSGITNIALFGIDSTSKTTSSNKTIKGRSDSIIILTINENDKTVKLTSILRDSWVPVERSSGTKNYKINAAYAYGGAQLAIKTINQNFGLDISEYASVSMQRLVTIIDYIGGIDMYITDAEREQINKSTYWHKDIPQLESSGTVHLVGYQALAFARIRKIDGDNYRAQRHQKVLIAMLEQIKSLPASEYPALLRKILGHVETSLTFDEIIKYTPLVTDSSLTVERTNIPNEDIEYKKGIFSDTRGGWVWKYDLEEAKNYIHKWIYGEEAEEDGETDDTSEPLDSSDTQSANETTNTNSQSEVQQ